MIHCDYIISHPAIVDIRIDTQIVDRLALQFGKKVMRLQIFNILADGKCGHELLVAQPLHTKMLHSLLW